MKNTFSIKRVFIAAWVAAVPAIAVLWYYPVITFRIRVATLFAALFIAAGLLIVTWKIKRVRWLFIILYVAIAVFLLVPVKLPSNRTSLRDAYCTAMKNYIGTRYVWGGEGSLGMDCSGLVRKGLEDALTEQGLLNLNSSYIREGGSLFWHDTTAEVIGRGYMGRTYPVTICPMLNSLDYSLLRRGDLAVTTNGEHVMAYLGDKIWIAADPGLGRVETFTIPEKNNAYFFTPMKIVRWKILTDSTAKN